jgi:hypothetical protein
LLTLHITFRRTLDVRRSCAPAVLQKRAFHLQSTDDVQHTSSRIEIVQPVTYIAGRARQRSATTNQYDVPRTRTDFGKQAFSIVTPRQWNELPLNCDNVTEWPPSKLITLMLLLIHDVSFYFGFEASLDNIV